MLHVGHAFVSTSTDGMSKDVTWARNTESGCKTKASVGWDGNVILINNNTASNTSWMNDRFGLYLAAVLPSRTQSSH